MSFINNVVSVLFSDFFLMIRNILGNKIQFNAISIVSPFASIRTNKQGKISIGKKTAVRANSEISAAHGVVMLGNSCFINRNCMVIAHERIEIGNNVTIGPGTYIYDHDHDGNGGYINQSVIIGDNVWIGANCVILKGVTIGADTTIGAGTLISKDVPHNTIIYQKREQIVKKKD